MRRMLLFGWLLCVASWGSVESVWAAPPLNVGTQKQLFLDDQFFAESHGMTLRMNPAVKRQAILKSDRPWESQFMGFYMSVVQDGDLCRMWYMARSRGHKSPLWCYAESRDGVHWEKPDLGLIEFQGSKHNNIVMTGTSETTFFLDPVAPPESRFKAVSVMYWPDPNRAGVYIHTSPDGFHWTKSPERVLPLAPDSGNQAFFDTRLKRYVVYLRAWDRQRKIARVEVDDLTKPWPYQRIEQPLYLWGKDKIAPPSRELPVVFGYDEQDPPNSDHYNAAAVQYADNCYFLFPSAYRHFPNPPKGKRGNDGLLDIQMATSRDGIHWNRIAREPYVSLGLTGEPDSSTLYMAVGMIRRGDRIFQYYGGFRNSHGYLGTAEADGTIFLLEQRPDGFVAAEADYTGGSFTTPPLVFAGSRLSLNIDLGALGTCRVGLLDEQGNPLPGYATSDCDLIEGNTLEKLVTWKGNGDLTSLRGRPVRLRVEMRAGRLFAFQFTP